MLQTQTVPPDALSLLKELMEIPEIGSFVLVGGTALSLKYGHRQSIDLDLFSTQPFNNDQVYECLLSQFGRDLIIENKPRNFGIFCTIRDVKVDIVRYPHPLIGSIYEVDGIRFISIEDIVAMKVQAVLGRARKKDFWDIATLLEHYSVDDFTRFHREKYSTQNLLITVPQAITYFADAEDDADPKSLQNQTWQSVKDYIRMKVSEYLK